MFQTKRLHLLSRDKDLQQVLQSNISSAARQCSSFDGSVNSTKVEFFRSVTNLLPVRCVQGTSNISGLISGNLVITHKGSLSITSHTSGATVHLTFKEPGMFSGKNALKHEVRDSLPHTRNVKLHTVSVMIVKSLHCSAFQKFVSTVSGVLRSFEEPAESARLCVLN